MNPPARFLAAVTTLASSIPALAHPHHTSVAEATWNSADAALEISLRLTPQDIETALRAADDSVRLDPPSANADAAFAAYIAPRFTASTPDGTPWSFTWVGFEHEDAFTWAHFTLAAPGSSAAATITNTILFDLTHDHDHGDAAAQINTVVVRFGEGDSRTFTATPDDPSETIDLPAHAPARPLLAPITRVVTTGEGPIRIVLVPGLASDERVFEPVLAKASDRYTFHCVTLPGFGGTEPPPAPADEGGTPWLDNAVDAIAHQVRERGWQDAIVVGHSMGGHLVFRLLAEYPDLFRGGVSIDGFAAVPLSPASLDPDQRRTLVETGMKPSLAGMAPEPWEAQIDAILLQVEDPGRRADLRAMMRSTTAPVAGRYLAEYMASDAAAAARTIADQMGVIACINDDMKARRIDREALRRIWESQLGGIPNIRVKFLEDTPHMAMDARPGEVGALIGKFVDRVESPDE